APDRPPPRGAADRAPPGPAAPGQPGVPTRQGDVLASLPQAVEREKTVGRDLGGGATDVAGAPVAHLVHGVLAPPLAPRVLLHGDAVQRQDLRVAAPFLDRHGEGGAAVLPLLPGPLIELAVELDEVLPVLRRQGPPLDRPFR